jgi:hypothetical protein
VEALLGEAAAGERITAAISTSRDVTDSANDPTSQNEWAEADKAFKRDSCLISIGGPTYNSLTRYLVQGKLRKDADDLDSSFVFDRRQRADGTQRVVALRSGSQGPAGEEWIGGKAEYYVIEKITRRGTKVFLCAGTSEAATAEAVQRLTRWRDLARTYGNEDFAEIYKLGDLKARSECVWWVRPRSTGAAASPGPR